VPERALWEKLIAGHPGPGGRQTGTKDDARNQLAYLRELSAAVKKAVDEGKSYADAQKDSSSPVRHIRGLKPDGGFFCCSHLA